MPERMQTLMTRKTMGLVAALVLGLLLTGVVALASFVDSAGGESRGTAGSDTMQGLNFGEAA